MISRTLSGKIIAAANQKTKERDYWLNKLSGELVKTSFPTDYKKGNNKYLSNTVNFTFSDELSYKLLKLSNGSDYRLHMILVAGLVVLIDKYTGNKDIMIGSPIYKQDVEGEFINTIITLRNQLKEDMIFKDLILQVKDTMFEATKHQDYPIEMLLEQLGFSETEDEFFLFDIVLLLENIHDKRYIQHIQSNMVFSFVHKDDLLKGQLEYNTTLYEKTTIKRIISHFENLLLQALNQINIKETSIEILSVEEKFQLLLDFNNTDAEYLNNKAIHKLFEEQVEKNPERVAVTCEEKKLTYQNLNEKANQVARVLRKNGVTSETVVGIMMERSEELIISLLAILKAGGAYLPIDPELPQERVLYMLEDSRAKLLLANSEAVKDIPFTSLQNLAGNQNIQVVVTNIRKHIQAFDLLPMPDRKLINFKNYKNKIGMASVTNSISLQSTRGCPYKCVYCHKVWSKNHVFRSAENMYNEIEYYYKNGVTNFAFIDDCFNLNIENSSRLFKMIIKNKLDVKIFFPNGLRGDLLTPDYIDLMVEAGTCNINLSLETASPRLQKLVKKNLDIPKFKNAIDYIAKTYPNVILEIATMHGFPTETEEEAMMTLDFIKDINWIHFPYIHILKIYPNTEMEELALAHGISKNDIMLSKGRAYHELPETLPFPKSFTRKYQTNFMNEYFLSKERLMHVLPIQMKILSEDAIVQKYNAYLPIEIKSVEDIINFAQLDNMGLSNDFRQKKEDITYTIFDRKAVVQKPKPDAKKILYLDLSQHFASDNMLYNVSEQPLGLIYLQTYLNQQFGDLIDGRIYKSGIDFSNFEDMKKLVDEYQPDLIGIRTLTFFKEFFHETVSLLRQWGINAPIIAGGPYAASDYDTILRDKNVKLVVLGEGEYTFGELIEKMLENSFEIPENDVLRGIDGIAFVEDVDKISCSREVVLLDRIADYTATQDSSNLDLTIKGDNLAYVMYTSGSTGKPKGVMVEHRQVNNCINWMQDKFNLTEKDVIVQRTNLTFDPSVWEIFWPLYIGGSVKVLTTYQSKDAEFLIKLMAEETDLTMMYCPATLVNAMVYFLNKKDIKPRFKLPWLLIGAEPISMDVVKNFYSYYDGKIVNTYGPTECTINNTYYDLERDDSRQVVPIGKPVANNKIYILSKDLQPVPVKIAAEICIAGDSVVRGYINNREKTEANFIDNPFGTGKLYKTGDIGRWLEDGNIEIMGRIDEQVKVRGYRIELGEIETALLNHENIDNCVVIVKDSNELQDEVIVCKKCGITSNYPGVKISDEGICEVCQDLNKYKKYAEQYFKTMDNLETAINDANQDKNAKYDCLLLYNGGKGAGYALYHLVERGLNVLALTYDNGYFTKSDLENIKKATSKLGVDHAVLTHKNSDQILKESLKSAHTVCRGCFHASSSIAGEYAYKNGIPAVVGATLSRGQIIENKLYMFFQLGIFDEKELEKEVAKLQKSAMNIDKNIFNYLDIDEINDGTIYNQVKFIDFYRYCDVTNEEIISYLNNKDSYWNSRKNFAVYSTNCPLKQVGDYGHLQTKGYHYYGSATSWEKRLGHISLENVKEDLECTVTQKGYESFLKKMGLQEPKSSEKNEKYLCAYLVSELDMTTSELRDYLSGQLPGYMIPSYFVQMDKIPLTPNGKIDRKALPRPEIKAREGYEAPGNEIEEKLAEIWRELLEVDKVGVNDNFFDIGGDSISAMKILNRVREGFHIEISLEQIFVHSTIKDLGEYIAEKQSLKDYIIENKIVKAPEQKYYDLAPVQLPEWYMHKLEPESPFYNINHEIMFDENLDLKVFTKVWQTLVDRHSILRTYFDEIDGKPIQKIHPKLEIKLEDIYVDYTDINEDRVMDEVKKLSRAHANTIFDFETGPLFSIKIIQISYNRYVFLFVVHHIIWDETSTIHLQREFMEIDNAFAKNREPKVPKLKFDYIDYAHWMNDSIAKGIFEKQRQYWLNKFKTIPAGLDLPTDYPRPAIQTFNGSNVECNFSKELKDRLYEYCDNNNVTLYMLLFSVFNLQMYRLSQQKDFVIGTPFVNRNHTEFEHLLGLFACALLLRCTIKEEMTFQDLILQIKETVIEAYDNHLYPSNLAIEELNLQTDLSRSKLFSVMFGLMNKKNDEILDIYFDNLQHVFELGESNSETSHFDLTLAIDESGEGISFILTYNTDLFKKNTTKRMLDSYIILLEVVINNSNKLLDEYNMLTEDERNKIIMEFNDTEREFDQHSCIHHKFERQVEKNPDHIALIFNDNSLTYRDLNVKANQLAHYLRMLNIGVEDKVGIMFEPSLDMIIAMLAALKAGAVYIPISSEYPEARQRFILENAGIQVVVSDRNLNGIDTRTVIMNSDWEQIEKMPAYNPDVDVYSNHLAYVIFTSGTTGTPKGIEIEHKGAVNLFEWIQDEYPLFHTDSTLLNTSFAFDASILEYFWPLTSGARIIIPREDERKDPVMIGKLAYQHKITFLQFVPDMLEAFLDACENEEFPHLHSLRYVICGAHTLTRKLRDRFYSLFNCRFSNHYGPTETTIDAITFDCSNHFEGDIVPIGKPVANTKIYILDQNLKPVPIGVAGEIFIESHGLARGYLGDLEKTQQSFIPNPFSEDKNSRLYKTGDLGKYLDDGNILFIGRKDRQVKIRGNRVELEEIENKIRSHPGISRSAVVMKKDENREERMTVYVELNKKSNSLTSKTGEEYQLYTLSQLPEKKDDLDQIHSAAWPEYFIGDKTYLQYWNQIMVEFSKYQVLLLNNKDEVVAVGNVMPIYWDGTVENLPEGWDSAVEKGFRDAANNVEPNTLLVLAGVVGEKYQNQGLGTLIIKAFKTIAHGFNLDQVLIPVRPTGKAQHPEMTFEKWCKEKRSDGLSKDNWIRIHERLGGKVLGIATESQYISGTVEEWKEWTGMKFSQSGEYFTKDSLQSIKIDLSRGIGEYYDPCIWVEHSFFDHETFSWEYIDSTNLQMFLKEYLPDYMIPYNYAFLANLPLTPSGKVNYKALPDFEFDRKNIKKFITPRNEIEEKIAGMWQEVLEIEKVGITENFFDIGGHS
ncbi:MAG: amino acid adenylation domain-containing protein, partial [Halanaerobiales bacterium]|nr:amino acid adenylation domain-containing protein [Halanaerobiales bacterium]